MYPKSDSSNVCGRRAGSRSSRLARNEASSFRSIGLVTAFWIREILARRLSTRRWVGMNRRPAHSSKPKTNASSGDRKSTRLNSSHLVISYAVFCLKKKNKYIIQASRTLEHSSLIPFLLGHLCSRRIALGGHSADTVRQTTVTVCPFCHKALSAPSA